MPWRPLATIEECPVGAAIECVAAGRIVALFNVGGDYFALDGVCPHQGGPLGKGRLDGCVLTCPWHGWQFDVRTGQHRLSANLCQERFDVRVEGGQISVLLPEE